MNKNQKIIAAGLRQIPQKGLRRLNRHLQAGKPVLLNGRITDFDQVEGDDGWQDLY